MVMQRSLKSLEEFVPLAAFLAAHLAYILVGSWSNLLAMVAAVATYLGLIYYLYPVIRLVWYTRFFPNAQLRWNKE